MVAIFPGEPKGPHVVSKHRGMRSTLSELEPRPIGESSVERATDGVDEHGGGGSRLEAAGFCERQDALDPPGAFVTVGPLRSFTPHNGKPQGTFGPVIGGIHAVLEEKDPQCVHLTEQVSDQLSGLVVVLRCRLLRPLQ